MRSTVAALFVLCGVGWSMDAPAFPHIVRPGETVAQIAETVYGRVELERVIVAANGLDGRRGTEIMPGMRLELPAVGHYRVSPGDSWQTIALAQLGMDRRADVLAHANDSHPWLVPEVGREIVVPYNLRWVASRGDTTQSVAYRFLERRDEAWIIASYNALDRAQLRQGEVLLVPLTDLALTPAGKQAALNAGALVRSEGGGAAREVQHAAERALPRLALDVRKGRYIEAIARGAALLDHEGLSEPQLADVQRLLTVAYVALGAHGLAATACAAWRAHDPAANLDPIDHSPKVLNACVGEIPPEARDEEPGDEEPRDDEPAASAVPTPDASASAMPQGFGGAP